MKRIFKNHQEKNRCISIDKSLINITKLFAYINNNFSLPKYLTICYNSHVIGEKFVQNLWQKFRENRAHKGVLCTRFLTRSGVDWRLCAFLK